MKRSTLDIVLAVLVLAALAAGGVYCCVVWEVQTTTRVANGATG